MLRGQLGVLWPQEPGQACGLHESGLAARRYLRAQQQLWLRKKEKTYPTVGAIAHAERTKTSLARGWSHFVSLLPNGGGLTDREEVGGPE